MDRKPQKNGGPRPAVKWLLWFDKLEMYSIIFPEQIDMLAQSNQIVLRPNRTDC